MREYTEKEIVQSYKGRCISERETLNSGYCGTCSINIHRDQLKNPHSWVHFFVAQWIKQKKTKPTYQELQARIKELEEELEKIKMN